MRPRFAPEFSGAPFVRLALPFLLGIAWQTQGCTWSAYALPAAAAGFAAYIFLYLKIKSYSLQWLHGAAMQAFLMLCGIAAAHQQPQHSALPHNVPIKLLAVAAEPPAVGVKYAKYTLAAKAWQDTAGGVHPADERVFVYMPCGDSAPLLEAGDEVMLGAVFSPIAPPQNPYEFNFALYARRQGIFCAAFADSAHCAITAKGQLPFFSHMCQKLRQGAVKILENTGISGEELGVLLTLTLGDRTRLDADLRNSYAAAGAVHILAVSGAHVMMIAMILGYALMPILRGRRGRAAGGCAVLLALWMYALATGFAPPVVRAVIMFSLLTAGKMTGNARNSYNHLACAAMLICLFAPNDLYNTGFQLSFAAVGAIAFFYPRIYGLIYVKNKILDRIWSAMGVAIAANIGTFPIVIYAFHQFPLYFVLTSVLIFVPVLFILILFVIVFILSLIPLINVIVPYIACPLKWFVMLLNAIVRAVESIPNSTAEGLWITAGGAWLLILGVLLAAFAAWSRRRRMAVWALGCAAAFGVLHAGDTHMRRRQPVLAVYGIKNTTLFSLIGGGRAFSVCDSADLPHNFDFNLKPYMASLGYRHLGGIPKVALQDLPRISDKDWGIYHSHIEYGGKTIAVAGRAAYAAAGQPLRVDFLIITSQCRQTPQMLLAAYAPKQVILDASVSRRACRRFEEYMASRNVRVHSVAQSGAFISAMGE